MAANNTLNSLVCYLFRKKMELFPNFEFGKFPPIGWLRNRLRTRLQQPFVDVNGLRLFLNLKDSPDWFINGQYEPALTRLLAEVVRPGDVVLDIGANVGYYTLLLSQKVGPTGKVYAFEPAPGNFELLCKNVETNGCTNVVAVNKAVSNEQKSIKLFLSKDNLGDHRIYDSGDSREHVIVDCIRLDDFLARSAADIRVIKIDVQGAEFQVLAGMTSLFNKNSDLTMFMEFWPYGLRRSGADPKAVLELLRGNGFVLCDEASPNTPVNQKTLEDLCQTQNTVNSNRYINLVCKRKSSA